jgi:hypothetical protein
MAGARYGPIDEKDLGEITNAFAEVDEWLRTTKTKCGIRFAEAGLDVAYDEESRRRYAEAMADDCFRAVHRSNESRARRPGELRLLAFSHRLPEFEPTPEQSAILAHDPGQHARVLAGPGTGKSATLVALIDQLLSGTEAPRLRLLTFTRAATGELAKRVSAHPAAAAERPSTIHSFAISVLVRNPGAGDLPEPPRIADDWEYENVVRPILARRADVGVRTLDRLVREMSAN